MYVSGKNHILEVLDINNLNVHKKLNVGANNLNCALTYDKEVILACGNRLFKF